MGSSIDFAAKTAAAKNKVPKKEIVAVVTIPVNDDITPTQVQALEARVRSIIDSAKLPYANAVNIEFVEQIPLEFGVKL